jgi:type IV fimbrial biogenesis protein FimT
VKQAELPQVTDRKGRTPRVGPMARTCAVAGFTLIEAMTSVAIAATLSTLAAPSLTRMLSSSEISSATGLIAGGLRGARNEAMKRNTAVTFTLTAGDGSPSWAVKQVSDDSVIQTYSAQEGGTRVRVTTEPAAAALVTFNPFGMVVPDAGDTPAIQQLVISSTVAPDARTLQINIDATHIRVCDPSPLLVPPDPKACLN